MTIKHLLNPPFPSDPRTPPWDQLPWVDVSLNQHKSTRVKKKMVTGWWYTYPSKKIMEFVSWDYDCSQYMGNHKIHVPNHQPDHQVWTASPSNCCRCSPFICASSCRHCPCASKPRRAKMSQKGSEKGYHRNMSAPPTLLVCFD